MVRCLIILLCLVCFIPELHAQESKTDSLLQVLNTYEQNDSNKVELYSELVLSYFSSNKDSAFYYANKGLQLSKTLYYKKGQAIHLKYMGSYYYYSFNYQKAIALYHQSVNLYLGLNDLSGIAKCKYNIGLAYSKMGDKQAVEYIEDAYQLFQKTEDKVNEANCLNVLGVYHWGIGGFEEALGYYKQSLQNFKEQNNEMGVSRCLFNMSLIFRDYGDYSNAIDYCQESLVMLEELGLTLKLASRINNLGLIHWQLEDYTLAQEKFNEALSLNKKYNDKEGIGSCYSNLGLINKELEQFDKALGNFKYAQDMFVEINYKAGLANTLYNIASVLINKEDYKQAYAYCIQAFNIYTETNNNEGLCHSMNQMGELYYLLGEYKKALDYSKKGLSIAHDLKLTKEENQNHSLQSKIYVALSNYKEAYKHQVAYKNVSDSLFNKKKIKKIAELEYKYEFDKKAQILLQEQEKNEALFNAKFESQYKIRKSLIITIVLLIITVGIVIGNLLYRRKVNRILHVQKLKIEEDNKELNSLNATKNKFFSIIAHDLRSPLGTLISLGELLWVEHDNIDSERQKALLKELKDGAESSFSLLDNLLTWARSSSNNMLVKPEMLDVNSILNKNLQFLKLSAENKKLLIVNTLPDDITVFADYNMIDTVIRNLLSNAVKFTRDNGTITIKANKENKNMVKIGISDTGIGIPENKLKEIFSLDSSYTQLGTNNEKGTGLGLKLCCEFIKKNKGKICVESTIESGTTVWVKLPGKF